MKNYLIISMFIMTLWVSLGVEAGLLTPSRESTQHSTENTNRTSSQPTTRNSIDFSNSSRSRSSADSVHLTSKYGTQPTLLNSQYTMDQASQPSAPSSNASDASSDESSQGSAQFTEASSDNTGKQSNEISEPTRYSSRDSQHSSAHSGDSTGKSSQDTSRDSSRPSGRSSHDTSQSSHDTTEDSGRSTVRSSWRHHIARIIDPDLADMVIRQAYASSGPELRSMAGALVVPEPVLADVIRQHVPLKPSLWQLEHLYALVVEGLLSDHPELAS